MNTLIKINNDNSVVVFAVKKGIDLEKEAEKVGGFIYKKEIPKSNFLKWDEEENIVVTNDELEQNYILKSKKTTIENFVYSKYTATKQSQDEKWVSNYTTKLKAQSVENLELQVVQMITSFYQGKTLAEALAPVTVEEQKPYFEKLVKVGIRTEWMENCIKEGNLAILENREPVYPEFPQIK